MEGVNSLLGKHAPAPASVSLDDPLRPMPKRTLTLLGETKTVTEWADDPRCAVAKGTLLNRVYRYGWQDERAVLTPPTEPSVADPRVERKPEDRPCAKCGQDKAREEYYDRLTAKGRTVRDSWCKACRRRLSRERDHAARKAKEAENETASENHDSRMDDPL